MSHTADILSQFDWGTGQEPDVTLLDLGEKVLIQMVRPTRSNRGIVLVNSRALKVQNFSIQVGRVVENGVSGLLELATDKLRWKLDDLLLAAFGFWISNGHCDPFEAPASTPLTLADLASWRGQCCLAALYESYEAEHEKGGDSNG